MEKKTKKEEFFKRIQGTTYAYTYPFDGDSLTSEVIDRQNGKMASENKVNNNRTKNIYTKNKGLDGPFDLEARIDEFIDNQLSER